MSKQFISIRFYSVLNQLLAKNKKYSDTIEIKPGQTVKDLIESFGIPHTEIGLILSNSEIVDFSYQLNNQDRITVFPKFFQLDVSSINKLGPDTPSDIKFIADVHLGKLAKHLRMLGFDCIWENNYDDLTIIELSTKENRIILTRDKGILKFAKVKYGYLIKSHNHFEQLVEIVERYDLINKINPFSKCIECNTSTKIIDKNKIIDRLEPKTKKYFFNFKICPKCNRIYWNGSHSEKMNKIIQQLKDKFKR